MGGTGKVLSEVAEWADASLRPPRHLRRSLAHKFEVVRKKALLEVQQLVAVGRLPLRQKHLLGKQPA